MAEKANGWPGRGQILAFVRAVAESLRGQPDELPALLALALEREAVVSAAYLGEAVDARLRRLQQAQPSHDVIVGIIDQTIRYIWLQEETHTTLLRNINGQLLEQPMTASWTEIRGRITGVCTRFATSMRGTQHTLAQALLAVGRVAGVAPAFTTAIRDLTTRDFLDFSEELEAAAVLGYERLQEVVHTEYARLGAEPINIGLASLLGTVLIDERRHRELFRTMHRWFDTHDRLTIPSAQRCIDAITAVIVNTLPTKPPRDDEERYASASETIALDTTSASFLGQLGVTGFSTMSEAAWQNLAAAYFLGRE